MFSYFTLDNLWTLLWQMVDIGSVWALVYYCLRIVKNNSRTIQIFKGVLLIVIIRFVATKVGLHTIASLADSIMNWGVVAIIIIFQPEIRSILEKIGKTSVFSGISTLTINERENLVNELVKACSEMSKTKTGALISIEQGHSLSDFIKTGTSMNSVVSSELLCSIFQYGTPLHDGAVIIQGVKIACAAAYFPPTTRELPTSYGARHRAAVGISEITDSITIVVSEETGNISIAQNGTLTVMSEASLKEFLLSIVGNQSTAKEKEEQQKETLKEQEAVHGKKPGVFAHYFKGKGRKTKDSSETISYTEKKKKEESVDIIQPETDLHDKLEIEDLAQKQATGLDQLFDNILNEGDKNEEAKPKKKRKKKAAQTKETNASKEENPKKEDGLSTLAHMSQELMEDVVEPETIVLHYESDEEGRDS
ncbi:tIGR00159 family protein [Amedibacillus dolichus CAG:375]|uniref:Diadenylate cyclase n=1 Tax=Amedibacillus dolichus CAG:375 TaxID=1263076 RepID=R7G7H9_9FIRM|nr:diadenylate cyclase CdaA [Amedibacillus dolichus]CDE22723.1 tIGR00159 family protein [Amedibacillus dolichus CAG:375]